MNIPENLKFTEDHEWVKVEDGIAIVGITDFAQSELGELVYIEVDTVGESLDAGEIFGIVEAVKTTSELFMPLSGEILEFNSKLDENEGDDPSVINEDPYGEGWIVKIKLNEDADLEKLLSPSDYEKEIG